MAGKGDVDEGPTAGALELVDPEDDLVVDGGPEVEGDGDAEDGDDEGNGDDDGEVQSTCYRRLPHFSVSRLCRFQNSEPDRYVYTTPKIEICTRMPKFSRMRKGCHLALMVSSRRIIQERRWRIPLSHEAMS